MAKKKFNIDLKQVIVTNFKKFVDFLKYNRQFFCFVILCLISTTLCRHYTIGNMWHFYPMFFDAPVIILLGSLAYLFKPKKQFIYFISVMLVITVMNIINTVYYAFFTDFASFGLLATMGQTAEVSDAVFEKLKLYHFIYVLMPIIFIIINRILASKDYFNIVEKVEQSRKLFFEVALVGGICLCLNISTLTGKDISRFSKQWNREYIVDRFGIIVYQGNDLVQTLRTKLSSLFGFEEAAKRFVEFFEQNPRQISDNKYTNKLEGYNVIGVHMESIMTFLIGLEINGVEVTPNLNKLVDKSMYFDNFYSQVSVGTSSDTEFTLNTSLMPVQSGTVFVSYYDRNYVSLEKLLKDKGYYTFSMHGNKASMWNRHKMHPSLGYMDFYSEEYYDIDEVIGLGLSDRLFFRQSEEIIKEISDMVKDKEEYKNYMGTLITLTNHTPFEDPYFENTEGILDVTYHTGEYDNKGEEIVFDYLEGTIMGDYLKSVHYADECLGEFIDYIRSHDEYKKTLFVFYGDHAAQLSKKQYSNFINYDFETGEIKDKDHPTYVDYDYIESELFKKTPLILWTSDNKLKGTYSYPMGMIDILPTIGNMLGIHNPYALGNDIFETKNDNVVVFPNGNFLTDKVFYYNSKDEYRIFSMDTISADYIEERKKYTENILNISNDIIVYNLIERAGDRIGSGTSNEQE